jgi:hypothetical protein
MEKTMVQFIRLAAFAAIVAFAADASATDVKVEEATPVAVTTTEEAAPVAVAAEEVKAAEEATKTEVKAEEATKEVKTKKGKK